MMGCFPANVVGLVAGFILLLFLGQICKRGAEAKVAPKRDFLTLYNVDFFDYVYETAPRMYTAEDIYANLERARKEGVDVVLWRLSAVGKETYPSKVRTPLYEVDEGEFVGTGYRTRANLMGAVLRSYDPLAVATQCARELGLGIYAWITIWDDYFPGLQSDFSRRYPHFQWKDPTGTKYWWGVLSYSHREVREHRLAQIREVAEYDLDGILLCPRTHSHQGMHKAQIPHLDQGPFGAAPDGFNEPIVARYQRLYGIDIRREPFAVERWDRVKGEFLTLFFKEAKAILQRKGQQLIIGVPFGNRIPTTPLTIHLDLESWARKGIADGLILGSGYDLYDLGWEPVAQHLNQVRAATAQGIPVYAWVRLWDWSNRFPGDTKPPAAVARIARKVQELGFDGAAWHEAWNISTHGLWQAIQGFDQNK